MHECPICHRTYQARTPLSRHIHNHSPDHLGRRHACETCGVSFARRDLLSRHQNNNHSGYMSSRRRTHTACDQCRKARMRCDGQMPCSACQERSKSCRYTDGRSRLSKAAPRIRLDSMPSSISSPRLLQTQDERQHDGDSQQQPLDGHAGPLLNETQEQPLDGLEGLLGQDQTEPHQIYTLGLPMDLDGIPWPWLHETSFLQDDPGLGDFGTVATHDYSAMLPAPESHDLCGDFRENDTVPDGQSHVAASSSHPVLEDARPLEAAEVDKLVHLASQPASGPGANAGGEDCFWDHVLFVATFIRGIATSAEQPLSAGDVFREHLQAYSTNFNRLWPMFVDSDIQAGRLHPILYLVQLSIGCMYGSPSAKHFGTLLHKSLRQLLTSFLAVESFDGDIIWLAHARLLTQVHGLYFGQPQGFSYAQVRSLSSEMTITPLTLIPAASRCRPCRSSKTPGPFSAHPAAWRGLAWGLFGMEVC